MYHHCVGVDFYGRLNFPKAEIPISDCPSFPKKDNLKGKSGLMAEIFQYNALLYCKFVT